MTEGGKSVKDEILDRFEHNLDRNEEIPREVVSLLKRDNDNADFGDDDDLREAVEQIVAKTVSEDS